jgi:hypothetical protein
MSLEEAVSLDDHRRALHAEDAKLHGQPSHLVFGGSGEDAAACTSGVNLGG